jgi:hypothetical protein
MKIPITGEEQMRARLLAVMVTALVLALAAPAIADPREDARDRRKAMQPSGGDRVAFVANGETRENMEQVVVNHFGSPNQGQVLIQTWVEPDWSDFEAVDIQGAVQAVKIRRAGAGFAKRVAIRVELYDNDGTVAFYSIRWDDDTLSSGRFLEAPGDWLNPTCLFAPASDLRARQGSGGPRQAWGPRTGSWPS